MRLFPLLLMLMSSCAAAQPASNPAAGGTADGKLSAQSSADQVLDALERRGRDMQGLSADVRYVTEDPSLGDQTIRNGRFWLDNRPESTRAHVVFNRKQVGEHVSDEKIEYILIDGKLIDRNYTRRAQATRTVTQPGERINLLKLGEGPFPLPIGQKREAVYQEFDVKKIDPSKDDPAGTVHIQLAPKPGTALARRFQTIDVWVNTVEELPQRMQTLSVNGNESITTDLSHIELNPQFKGDEFTLPQIDAGWNISEERFDRDEQKHK